MQGMEPHLIIKERVSSKPSGAKVTAVWSGRVYVGEGVAASCKTCVPGFRHYLTVGFGEHFKTNKWPMYSPLLSCKQFFKGD